MVDGPDDPWTPEEAFAAFPTLAIEADGSIGREEQDALTAYLEDTPALGSDVDDVAALIKRVHRAVSEHGEEGTLRFAAQALPAELREAAYRAALDMTWSDDDSDAGEQGFLATAAQALGLDAEHRDRLIQQVAARQE